MGFIYKPICQHGYYHKNIIIFYEIITLLDLDQDGKKFPAITIYTHSNNIKNPFLLKVVCTVHYKLVFYFREKLIRKLKKKHTF